MKRIHLVTVVIALISGVTVIASALPRPGETERVPKGRNNDEKIKLPDPKYDSDTSVEQALLTRRSVREYKDEPLRPNEVSQLLWAAQGITDRGRGFRTAPSAGALYPLEIYAVIGNVRGLEPGVYKYRPHQHELERVRKGDVRAKLSAAALEQTWIGQGAIVIVFSAVYERATRKYGDRGIRYVYIEVGHAAQSLCLQAASLNLGAGVVGAFRDKQVKKILNARESEQPLYIVPVGVK